MMIFGLFCSASGTVAVETQMEAAMRRTLMRVQRNTARGGGRSHQGGKPDSLSGHQNMGYPFGIAAPDPSQPSGGVADMP
jgi:hypothetical protein